MQKLKLTAEQMALLIALAQDMVARGADFHDFTSRELQALDISGGNWLLINDFKAGVYVAYMPGGAVEMSQAIRLNCVLSGDSACWSSDASHVWVELTKVQQHGFGAAMAIANEVMRQINEPLTHETIAISVMLFRGALVYAVSHLGGDPRERQYLLCSSTSMAKLELVARATLAHI